MLTKRKMMENTHKNNIRLVKISKQDVKVSFFSVEKVEIITDGLRKSIYVGIYCFIFADSA